MPPPPAQLPVLALLEETVVPGEERALPASALPVGALADLAARSPPRVCALTVTTFAEVPSLVASRWATECAVVSVDAERAVLRGERRVRILSASGRDGGFWADVLRADDQPAAAAAAAPAAGSPPAGLGAQMAGARALLAALESGAAPSREDWAPRVGAALGELHRAVATPEQLRASLAHPGAESLARLAREVAGGAATEAASRALESAFAEAAREVQLTAGQRQKLWSQVVEVQRRLDVHDPARSPEDGDTLGRLQTRLSQCGLPKAAREVAKRELRLLRGMKPDHHEYSTYLAHLELVARLPWHPDPAPPPGMAAVRAALDRGHAGLERVKRRVMEYLAVRSLGGSAASTVLCLAGPPGVGKTSVARAVADALGKPFVRVPLGGVHDECEVRGHRVTFNGAQPGRLLAGLARAGSASAVVLLDEIDKMGSDRQRSPYAALLEVLDPEQCAHFQDNYLGVPYDLSHALFICTANDMSEVHETLRDRLETVELEGYSAAEKVAIAREHLIPALHREHGLPGPVGFPDELLGEIVERYTREAGVRQLRRALAAVHRARALEIATGARSGAEALAPCGRDEVTASLGPPRWTTRAMPETLPAGTALGLSVGADGGAVMFLEVGAMPGGAAGELRLTGRMGDVMRESAQAALAHLRVDPARYGIPARKLAGGFHVHAPEAATPKDGPSAGLALAIAFISAARGTPARADVAVTGEVTLGGRVLPVGGVRAKLLAAERAGARRVIIPEGNRADVPAGLAVEVVPVGTVGEAVAAAFASEVAAAAGGSTRRAGAVRGAGAAAQRAKARGE